MMGESASSRIKHEIESDFTSMNIAPQIYHIVAPPLVIAFISSSVYALLWNLLGSSVTSKYSPCLGWTEPSSLPDFPPIAPYANDEDAELPLINGADCWPPNGPCD